MQKVGFVKYKSRLLHGHMMKTSTHCPVLFLNVSLIPATLPAYHIILDLTTHMIF